MKKNLKSIVHEVPLDYFLFSCLEFEKLCQAVPKKLNDENRWMSHHADTVKNAQGIGEENLGPLIRNILTWYRDNTKTDLSQQVTLENISEISKLFVFIRADVSFIVKAATGSDIPEFTPSSEPPAVLQLIEDLVKEIFPQQSKHILEYIKWAHATLVVEDAPLGSRPPVGRYSPFFRPGRSENTFRSGKSIQKKPMGLGQKEKHRDHETDRGRRERPTKEIRKERPKGDRPSRGADRKKDRDPKLEQLSHKEVLLAVGKLRDDPNLNEFKLSPANSYYRRLQHQQIRDEGYYSISSGEGQDRAVVIVREEPANKDGSD